MPLVVSKILDLRYLANTQPEEIPFATRPSSEANLRIPTWTAA